MGLIEDLRQYALDLKVEAQHNRWLKVPRNLADEWAIAMSKAASTLDLIRSRIQDIRDHKDFAEMDPTELLEAIEKELSK